MDEAKSKTSPAKQPPPYEDMVRAAISALKERRGTSRQTILKYIVANFEGLCNKVGKHLNDALREGVNDGTLTQTKGSGARGRFRLGKVKPHKRDGCPWGVCGTPSPVDNPKTKNQRKSLAKKKVRGLKMTPK